VMTHVEATEEVLDFTSLPDFMNSVRSQDVNKLKTAPSAAKYATLAFTLDGENQYTPLHFAASRELLDSIEALTSGIAQVNPDILVPGTGLTPLHFAASMGKVKSIKKLLSLGASINPDFDQGWTPLHAAAGGEEQAVILLLKKGAKVNVKNSDGLTPLHIAATVGGAGIIESLISYKADIEAKTNLGATPLILAATSGSYYTVESLLTAGANIKVVVPANGRTPLHFAAEIGRKEVLRMLIRYGADINALDKSGKTPAEMSDKPKISEFIRKGAPGGKWKRKHIFQVIMILLPLIFLIPVFFEIKLDAFSQGQVKEPPTAGSAAFLRDAQ